MHIAEFIDDRFAGKPNAARKYKQLVSLLMQHAVRKGFRDNNPAREVGMQDYRERARSRYLSDDELTRIRAGALDGTRSGEMIVCMIDLALITGQRIGDILDLKWAQVSDDGILFRPSKIARSTGAIVPVRMTVQLSAVLSKARAIGKVKGLTVVHTLHGRPLSYSGAHSAWRRAVARAGIENARIHDLRHRALTDAKQQGKNAQALGGHADATMTERYIEKPSIEWIDPPEIGVET